MNEFWPIATGFVLVVATLTAYSKHRDTLHPLVFLGPLFFYSYCAEPLIVANSGELERFFQEPSILQPALLLYFSCCMALAIGASGGGQSEAIALRKQRRFVLTPQNRNQLQRLAWIMGCIGVAAFSYGLWNVGGFVEAYSRAKGGGRVDSGYIGEAVNLGLPAVVLFAFARQKERVQLGTILTALFFVSPNLIQGTFGGRRGPIFLALMALVFAWFVYRGRKPSLTSIGVAFAGVMLVVILAWSQRQHFHLGSDDLTFNADSLTEKLFIKDLTEGNNFVYGSALTLTAMEHDRYYWGWRYFVTTFIRPIPRQIWPTKYNDTGATWVTGGKPGLAGFSEAEWISGVGWVPVGGSAAGSVVDVFLEFSWGAVIAFFLLGRFFAFLHQRSNRLGGLWSIIYLQACMLTIYLATQSFSAFFHRFFVMAIPTWIIWKKFVEPAASRAREKQPQELVPCADVQPAASRAREK